MQLIIVSGPEATGKTAIGKVLAERLGIAYESKDAIKEPMYDVGARSTWNFSWYENLAKDEFFKIIESYIARNESVIIESNFYGSDKKRLAACLNDRVVVNELFCKTKGLVSFRRFVARNESGRRHPGHHDRRWYASVLFGSVFRIIGVNLLYKPLHFSDRILFVDTTDFLKVDYDTIVDFVQQASPKPARKALWNKN
jgi:hypothetical protein